MRVRGNLPSTPAVPGIVKLILPLAVLGLLGYDGFVTVATHLKAEDDAQNVAYAVSQYWYDNPSTRTLMNAYQEAVDYEAANNPKDHVCEGSTDPLCGTHGTFSVDPDGTVHLVVRRTASTLIFKHFGFMKSVLVAYESGDANQSN